MTVQKEGSRTISRKLKYYNLDIIISVGYRIKSLKGTQFRQWANKILKEYLIKGFSINEKLLRERTQQLQELKNAVLLQEKVVVENHLNSDQSIGLIKIITDHTLVALTLLIAGSNPLDKEMMIKITVNLLSSSDS